MVIFKVHDLEKKFYLLIIFAAEEFFPVNTLCVHLRQVYLQTNLIIINIDWIAIGD